MLAFEFSNWYDFCFILEENCIRKCLEQFKPSNMRSKILEELADEENDPDHASATRNGPNFLPWAVLVGSRYFIFDDISTH